MSNGSGVLLGAGRRRRWLMVRLLGLSLVGWLVVTIAVPQLVTDTYDMRLLALSAIWAVNAIALNIVLGYTGLVNLGQSAFMACGAYVAAILTTTLHWNPWLALGLGLVAGALAGSLVALPAARIGGHYFALVTLAAGEIVQVVLGNWSGLTGGADGISGIPVLSLGGYSFDGPYQFFYLAMAALALVALASFVLRRGYIGRSLLAIKDDELAAKARGIPTGERKVIAFVLCGAFSGLSGGLYASFVGYVDPSSFTVTQNSILVLSMVLLGGAGSIYGVIAGAFVLTLLPEYLRFLGTSYLIVYGALIIVVILFLRGGLASLPGRLWSLGTAIGRGTRRPARLPTRTEARQGVQ